MGIKKLLMALFCSCCVGCPLYAQPSEVIPQEPVTPSPWWAVDRYGQNLVTDIQIDSTKQEILLTVDSGVWNGLDYLERYSTLQRLASAARPYQYTLILQNRRKTLLASYAPHNKQWTIAPENLGALPLRPPGNFSR